MSIDSGMWDNVIGLLDELNTFFDIIIGMIPDPTLSKQHEPKPVAFSFKSVKENITEINKSIIPRFQKLANIIKWKNHN